MSPTSTAALARPSPDGDRAAAAGGPEASGASGGPGDPARLLTGLVGADPSRAGRITHVERVAAREARTVPWPTWTPPELVDALARCGVGAAWSHQVEAAEHARHGRHVVISTGTASGKSLAYWLPALTAVLEGAGRAPGRVGRLGQHAGPGRGGGTVLYLSPTKALAHDQLRAVNALGLSAVRAAALDGDVAQEERTWIREHANYVLTNPDMLHRSVLPQHARWARLLRGLRVVVVDECHGYRGVFGSHVAAVLRRLRRLAARYGADPVFVLASATASDPAATASRLTGLPVVAVADDGSPRGARAFVFWEPPLVSAMPVAASAPGGGAEQTVRRSATAETSSLLTDLVIQGARTVAFVRSRRGAEAVASHTRRLLGEVDLELARRVAAYRAGYLPEERRAVEADLQSGALLAVATTSALELGVDVSGLDAVIMAGWPGTRASFWQQAGRAGRSGRGALAILVGGSDPLDSYVLHHPDAVFGRPVEATVLDPQNPYVLAPHLCAAAAEQALTEEDLELFGPGARALLDGLVDRGMLRRRPTGWFWTSADRACELADLRGTGGAPISLVEDGTGRLLGTVDAGASHSTAHDGAVYVHQGATHVVRHLDLDDRVAIVARAEPDWTTSALDVTDIRILDEQRAQTWGDATLSFGQVHVTSRVVGYLRKRLLTNEVISQEKLELPERQLQTAAVWWTLSEAQLRTARVDPADVPGAAHAAEHAAIGLLGLVATCDRWDIGGMSTALHPDTGRATVFVHDGHPGGAGFAERGYEAATSWLAATREAIAGCGCDSGCPACVQSPKCGNGNEPLDKAGAVRLLDVLLAGAPARDGMGVRRRAAGKPQLTDA